MEKRLGIHIKIRELNNGFVVDFFSEKGDSKFDGATYCATVEDMQKALADWIKSVKKKRGILNEDKSEK
jgi:hypothetical protein